MRRGLLATALTLAGLGLPAAACACAVCWGGSSGSAWIDASELFFVFLLVMTYGVIGGGIFGFVAARRRARRDREGDR